MANQDSACGLLGLALRASRLAVGDEPVHDLLGAGKARAVFLASDAGAGIVKKIVRRAQETGVPVLTMPETKAELGGALGRASCAVCATGDIGFAASAAKKLAGLSEANAAAAEALGQKNTRIMARRAKPKKQGAGGKVTTYIDIEEDEFDRRFGKPDKK